MRRENRPAPFPGKREPYKLEHRYSPVMGASSSSDAKEWDTFYSLLAYYFGCYPQSLRIALFFVPVFGLGFEVRLEETSNLKPQT